MDAVFETNNQTFLSKLTIGLIALYTIQFIFGFLGSYHLKLTGENIVTKLRSLLYSHLQKLDLKFFNNEQTGNITSRLISDVTYFQNAITHSLSSFWLTILKLIGSIIFLFTLNWRLALIILVAVPPTVLASRYFGRIIHTLSRNFQDLLANASAIAEEGLSNIRTVKAFNRTEYEIYRYDNAINTLLTTAISKAKIQSFFVSFTTFLFGLTIVIIFWYGGLEVLANRLTAGDLVASFFYAQHVGQSIGTLSRLYESFNSAAGAAGRIFNILDTEPETKEHKNVLKISDISGHICFDQVSFEYDTKKPVLHSINLEAKPGETIALVGPSGAGKSTILNLIPRLFEPNSGRISLDGHNIQDIKLSILRNHIALVSQEIQLFNDTVKNNIKYGRLSATDEEIVEAALAANAHEFITKQLIAGYDTIVGERGVKLSRGQRQRISIARALISETKVLLLDEVTTSLDAKSKFLVEESIEILKKKYMCTTFVISHQFSSITNADKILVIDGGHIIGYGTHQKLISTNSLYRELADHQFQKII